MQSVGVIGIFIEGAQISGNGIVQVILGEMLHPLIVKIFFVHWGS
jgi:hypothetical protein